MAISSKLFEALSGVIKMNDLITRVSEDIRVLSKEVRDIDKRVVRLETFIEIAKEKTKSSKMVITEN
ncbi:MAG: hypothetical protein CFE62_006830 [Candidatus Aquirickettsiella gammari]|jgi:hypothetical protein|uniref:Uncharacterized protein n=1 Tax=Candidatus Aquirickettsiella gammari TaxID=2016198 RepID=A0A370CF65_9COXI|nr:MAG: hypothetical protein CFE62_006830 [Candidatus Aquirickettsiella gammari]